MNRFGTKPHTHKRIPVKTIQNRCITLAFTTQVQPGQDVNIRGIPHKEALINAYT